MEQQGKIEPEIDRIFSEIKNLRFDYEDAVTCKKLELAFDLDAKINMKRREIETLKTEAHKAPDRIKRIRNKVLNIAAEIRNKNKADSF